LRRLTIFAAPMRTASISGCSWHIVLRVVDCRAIFQDFSKEKFVFLLDTRSGEDIVESSKGLMPKDLFLTPRLTMPITTG
jgi:hypothetical protein